MATGINKNGSTVSVNDQVSILGSVVSYTGSGSLASVTVQTPLAPSTVVVTANDCQSVDHPLDSSHTAVSISGKYFGLSGNSVSILGVVTAISGSGITALLTVKLKSSSASIIVPAGACQSAT